MLDAGAIDGLLKSVVSLAVTNKPIVLKNRVGKDKIVVELASDDLAALIQADDSGILKKCQIKSVSPVFREAHREFKFYPEYPMLETFSKSDSIRLFKQAQFREGFSYRHFNWQASCFQPHSGNSVAAITIGTSSGDLTQLTESIVIRKEDVANWRPDRPIELLTEFLDRFGCRLTTTLYGSNGIMIDKEITHISLPHRTIFEEIFTVVKVSDRHNAVTLFHSEHAGAGKLHLLHMFAVPKQTITQMRSVAKNEAWF